MGRCFRLVPLLAAAAAQNHVGNFQGKHDAVGAMPVTPADHHVAYTDAPVRVHAWVHGGRDGFGSQFFNKMAVFGACRLVPDDGCCYIHNTIKVLEHGVDAKAAEAATGLRSDARCASRHPQTLPTDVQRVAEAVVLEPPPAALGRQVRRTRYGHHRLVVHRHVVHTLSLGSYPYEGEKRK